MKIENISKRKSIKESPSNKEYTFDNALYHLGQAWVNVYYLTERLKDLDEETESEYKDLLDQAMSLIDKSEKFVRGISEDLDNLGYSFK